MHLEGKGRAHASKDKEAMGREGARSSGRGDSESAEEDEEQQSVAAADGSVDESVGRQYRLQCPPGVDFSGQSNISYTTKRIILPSSGQSECVSHTISHASDRAQATGSKKRSVEPTTPEESPFLARLSALQGQTCKSQRSVRLPDECEEEAVPQQTRLRKTNTRVVFPRAQSGIRRLVREKKALVWDSSRMGRIANNKSRKGSVCKEQLPADAKREDTAQKNG